ncbi:unnamed protein product, partial [Aphanomyces euteiches]
VHFQISELPLKETSDSSSSATLEKLIVGLTDTAVYRGWRQREESGFKSGEQSLNVGLPLT